MKKLLNLLMLSLGIFLFSNCEKETPTPPQEPQAKPILIFTDDIRKDFILGDDFTCFGANISPAISWSDQNTQTVSYTLIVSNGKEDSEREVYWILSDIPASVSEIQQGNLPSGSIALMNSSGTSDYSGPCPEEGSGKQDFTATLYALTANLELPADASEVDLISKMSGNILKEVSLTTFYSTFRVFSNNFPLGGTMPDRFTCNGDNTSPHIKWEKGIENPASYALLFYDVSAANFSHWIVANIKNDVNEILEGLPPNPSLRGSNGRGERSYFGPCPPGTNPHKYYLTIYALDKDLDLETGFRQTDFRSAIEGHILDQTDVYWQYP